MAQFSSLALKAMAVAILCWLVYLLIESHDMSKWPHTKGHVVSSSLTIQYLPEFWGLKDESFRLYGVDVRYEYVVGDGLYSARRRGVRDTLFNRSQDALEIMNKYRRQHEVTVYYRPDRPWEAVIEPENIGNIFLLLLVEALLLFWWFLSLGHSETYIQRDRYLHLGNIYQQQGQLDQALEEYNKVIHTQPDLAIGYMSRGSVYLQKDRWEPAIADFNKAIAIDPRMAIVYFNRGQAFLGNRQYEEALKDMEKAMSMGFAVKPEILERIKGYAKQ